jgi:hypothetical protein
LKTKLALLLVVVAAACSPRKEQTNSAIADSLRRDSIARAEVKPEVVDTVKKDQGLDALGRFIAGLEQTDSTVYSNLEQESAWQEYKASADSSWKKLYDDRLGKMKTWQSETFSHRIQDSLKIFYPFSGPDFLHAYYLYPTANYFVLVALEPIQEAVQLEGLSVRDRYNFLDSLRHSLRDSFKKSFFETNNMREDFKRVKGVLPLLYWLMERTGHELLQQKFVYVDADGKPLSTEFAKLYKQKIPAVWVKFRDRDSKQVKELYYFNINMLSSELKKRPGFEKFLQAKKPYNTFVKSASYLMHRDSFDEIRRLIMDNSATLFQDDTGIPFKEFKPMGWDMQYYGEYVRPIKLFENRYQADLDSAFRRANRNPLPFSIGYHYGSKQNYMLATKVGLQRNK